MSRYCGFRGDWFPRLQSNVSTSPTVWLGWRRCWKFLQIYGLWRAKSYNWGIFFEDWDDSGGILWKTPSPRCLVNFRSDLHGVICPAVFWGGGWFPKRTTSQSKTQITNIASIKKHTKSIHVFVKSPCLFVKSPFLLVKCPSSFGGPTHGHPGFPTSPSTAGAAARAALGALGEATLVVGRPASLPAPAARRVEEADTVNPRTGSVQSR